MLELDGFSALTAANGEEGLSLLKSLQRENQRPCLILLDLMMPIMNGWQFVEALEHETTLATIPVVIVTAFSDKSRSLKSSGVLKKPIEMDALYSIVHHFCELSLHVEQEPHR
jgi:CheY-like chemotaxis protein